MSNLLTIIRIIGVIPLVLLINKNGLGIDGFILFAILAITDFFDGYLARKYNNCTKFGNIADGVADKILMISVTVILLVKKIIPYWTLIIFLRDFISIILALYQTKKTKIIPKSNIYGKLKTTFHIVAIAATLLFAKWTILSTFFMILAIAVCIPELFYISKVIKNK